MRIGPIVGAIASFNDYCCCSQQQFDMYLAANEQARHSLRVHVSRHARKTNVTSIADKTQLIPVAKLAEASSRNSIPRILSLPSAYLFLNNAFFLCLRQSRLAGGGIKFSTNQ